MPIYFQQGNYYNNKLPMLFTPVKGNQGSPTPTLPSTQAKTVHLSDYKSKIMDLIDENTQLRTKQLILKARADKFESDLQQTQKQIADFLRKTNCQSLTHVLLQFNAVQNSSAPYRMQPSLKQTLLSLKHKEIGHNLSQFQKNCTSEAMGKKLAQLEEKYKSHNNEKKQWQEIRKECESLRAENARLEQTNEKLREELKNSIEKFQGIESVVQQKLKYYVQRLKQYEEMFKNSRQELHEFSFSKEDEDLDRNKEKERKDRNQIEQMNAQCYRASIEGLLEQNKRLKKSFQSLYRLKQGQEVPEELQKEINIMKSIIDLNQGTE